MHVARFLSRRQLESSFVMSRHLYLDVSPPPYTSSRDLLDKNAFKKSFNVLGARVHPAKTGALLKAPELRNALMDLPKIRTVVSDHSRLDDDRLVLLRMSKESDIPLDAKAYLDQEAKSLVEYSIELNYDYWSLDECLRAFLPEELKEGAPTGFSITGHIAHVNLNEEYLPYKHIIGQLVLDKNKSVKTVVNKLDTIDHEFRFFKMELIAGEPDYVVEHHESGCSFTFDFTQVYWNSRLHTEHARLVSSFGPEQVIADVFAGVGPFAVPAAKKGCAVLGNDLNPNSAKYLQKNVKDNKVDDLVRVSCEDGREFIRNVLARVYDEPFPAYTGPKASKTQWKKDHRRSQKTKTQGESLADDTPPRRMVSHFVMNLPDSAITFLDAFRGLLVGDDCRDLASVYPEMPMVHCYCFTREVDVTDAERDICWRVEEKLGHQLADDTSIHLVRSVAPNKEMYCISFRLPRAVAFNQME